jgi:2-C-methyl-D-erythritol 4-phosphate cytidylyltransferase
MHRKVWGLVPAGGSGERFGGDTPKQLLAVAGKPLLAWTLERLIDSGLAGVTVALPQGWLASVPEIFDKHPAVHWVAGGATRQQSVVACLAASPADVDLVLVHDGARAAVSVVDVQATIAAVGDDDGAILGRPVVDTLKRLDGTHVAGTVDRRSLFRAETPQVFKREVLSRALQASAQDGFEGTDEAAIVERLGAIRINTAVAMRPNPKLTRRQDLRWVELLLRETGDA